MVAEAGEEEAVTATKSFTATLAATYALATELARDSGATTQDPDTLTRALRSTSNQVRETLALCGDTSQALASKFKDKEFFFILGSGPNYATALEGALKLKESCNLYSEGFATREFLHGPMQLVDSGTPVFILQSQGESKQVHDLGASFLRFGAPTTVIRRKGEGTLKEDLPAIEVAPDVAEVFSPLIYVIPLQLCAYYSSVIRGLNPDRPEKLTKVVK
jgi:glucosamine--fructose-6-phosphate aminotransferase (isomerizing)